MICPERGTENICKACGESKPCEDMTPHAQCTHSHRPGKCRSCTYEYSRNRYSDGRRWAWNMKHKYGITGDDYYAMLDKQGGVCAGCLKDPGRQRLHVDHDHACCPGVRSCGNCVRALLCMHCNHTLGSSQDNPDTLRRLAAMLERG